MSPISTIKSNLSVSKIIAFTITFVATMLILDALSATDWLLFPYRSANGKFFGGKLPSR